MKLRIEVDTSLSENEIIIRCPRLSDEISQIEQALSQIAPAGQKMELTKGDTQYYLLPEDILFFETEAGSIAAHTGEDIFYTRLKLYELESILSRYFMRISKSAILNTHKVYAINRSLTSSSTVEFEDSHKQVFVSRHYYKPLIEKLEVDHFMKTQGGNTNGKK